MSQNDKICKHNSKFTKQWSFNFDFVLEIFSPLFLVFIHFKYADTKASELHF